jgi:hypothetical protein
VPLLPGRTARSRARLNRNRAARFASIIENPETDDRFKRIVLVFMATEKFPSSLTARLSQKCNEFLADFARDKLIYYMPGRELRPLTHLQEGEELETFTHRTVA